MNIRKCGSSVARQNAAISPAVASRSRGLAAWHVLDERRRGDLAVLVGLVQRPRAVIEVRGRDVAAAAAGRRMVGDEAAAGRAGVSSATVASPKCSSSRRRCAACRPRAAACRAVPVAFEHLGHGHSSGLGVADVAVSGDEPGELDLGGAKVARAEATADGLSRTCIVPAGAPLVAVPALAEEVVADPEDRPSLATTPDTPRDGARRPE